MKIDLDKIARMIKEVSAECVMPRFRNLQEDEVMTKTSSSDFVTVADIESEKMMTRWLNSEYPKARVIGEESFYKDPAIIRALSEEEHLFVIDPIDGTRAFKSGQPCFTMLLAYAYKGEITSGFIYGPVEDNMAMGEMGGGVLFNGSRCSITPNTGKVAEMRCATTDSSKCFDGIVKEVLHTRGGGLAYLRLLENKVDFISFLYRALKPWDHMAGMMLVKEAGAVVHTLPADGYDYMKPTPRLMIVNSEENFRQLSRLIHESF